MPDQNISLTADFKETPFEVSIHVFGEGLVSGAETIHRERQFNFQQLDPGSNLAPRGYRLL